jgi:hypothetical protein
MMSSLIKQASSWSLQLQSPLEERPVSQQEQGVQGMNQISCVYNIFGCTSLLLYLHIVSFCMYCIVQPYILIKYTESNKIKTFLIAYIQIFITINVPLFKKLRDIIFFLRDNNETI